MRSKSLSLDNFFAASALARKWLEQLSPFWIGRWERRCSEIVQRVTTCRGVGFELSEVHINLLNWMLYSIGSWDIVY